MKERNEAKKEPLITADWGKFIDELEKDYRKELENMGYSEEDIDQIIKAFF